MAEIQRFGKRRPELAYRVRPAAYAIVFDDNLRVACVSEASGLFLPGGGLEVDEDPISALHREVAEECGRRFEIIAPLEPAIQFFCTTRDEPFELHASFFLGRFGQPLDRPGQHELSWQTALPDSPAFFHECHRWAVQQALRRDAA
jgi:8-oxo-dGTP pyrophosphatase MutT (NUDIX family)